MSSGNTMNQSSSMPSVPTITDKIEDYKLPVKDVQKQLRNFPGFQKKQYFNLGDLQKGDIGGTTETDSKTNPKSEGYSTINKVRS